MKLPDLKDIWNNPRINLSEEEVENALKQLFVRISLYEELFPEKKRYLRRGYAVLRIAGILLLPVFASFLTYLSLEHKSAMQEVTVAYTEYTAPVGERREIVLEDSTRVYLNSGSLLITPEKFIGKDRTIYLIGEGYFKVASDKEKPFKIKTSLVEIEALGTEFSVSAYSEDNSVKVILAEGSVRLSTLHVAHVRSIIMSPDHLSVYHPQMDGFVVSEVDASEYTSWKDGVLTFDETPMGDVLRRLEIQYGVQISYDQSDQKIIKHAITAKFVRNESLTDILDALSEIIGFKYRIRKSQVIIR